MQTRREHTHGRAERRIPTYEQWVEAGQPPRCAAREYQGFFVSPLATPDSLELPGRPTFRLDLESPRVVAKRQNRAEQLKSPLSMLAQYRDRHAVAGPRDGRPSEGKRRRAGLPFVSHHRGSRGRGVQRGLDIRRQEQHVEHEADSRAGHPDGILARASAFALSLLRFRKESDVATVHPARRRPQRAWVISASRPRDHRGDVPVERELRQRDRP